MEHTSMCQAWERLRDGRTIMYSDASLLGESTEQQRIEAFELGRTGYPFVDACLRCLHETGWLNFRMRCMLVSFAVFNLWLDWRAIAGFLARCFLDYEPGIHYPQLQMQAGTTGIDLRCYSILKQAKDQDPKGEFTRKYVRELASIPDGSVHEPWKWKGTAEKCAAAGYPPRIVDEAKTGKASKTTISAMQKGKIAQTAGQLHLSAMQPGEEDDTDEPPQKRKPPPQRSLAASFAEAFAKQKQPGEEHVADEPPPQRKPAPQKSLAFSFAAASAKLAAHLRPWSCPRCTLWNDLVEGMGSAPRECGACEGPAPEEAEVPRAFQQVIRTAAIELD